MAAYAAVISLKHTINSLLNSSRTSLVPSTREILQLAYKEATSLQKALERQNDARRSSATVERLDALEGPMRDCTYKLEDVVDFHELTPQDEEVKNEASSFSEAVKKFEMEYMEELSRDDNNDNDNDDALPNVGDYCEEMVGHSQDFTQVRDEYLLCKMRPDDTYFLAFLGDVGSGRSAVANTVFQDLRRAGGEFFDCSAWVKVGEGRSPREVLMDILSQVDNLAAWEHDLLIARGDEMLLHRYLYRVLENRRYMIALDDVHETEVVELLKISLPDESNGSMVMFTTSIQQIAELGDGAFIDIQMRPARVFEDTVCILLTKILGRAASTREHEEYGRKIVENCRCRPIAFAKILIFLFHYEAEPPLWSKIAADKENPIFMVEDELQEISKIKREIQYFDLDHETTKTIHEMISDIINFPTYVKDVRSRMHPQMFFSKMQIVSVVGMAGIGKSTFAQKISNDELILSHFEHRVWLTIDPKYENEDILIDILAQIYPDVHIKGDEKLAINLCAQVSYKRCLIVLDDLWSIEPLSHLKNLFPNIKGTIMVTTRLENVAKFAIGNICVFMDLLDENESWYLLQQKVFAGGSCQPELEKSGHKIAAKCDGLPLLIVKVAKQLLKAEISIEYWEKVASGKNKLVFMNAHREISETLLPSYECLPQRLKPCFIYMGVFLETYEIPACDLDNLWMAETFLETNSGQMVRRCFRELANQNLVMSKHGVFDWQNKTVRLHSVFWHLSNSKAMKIAFFHAMNIYEDGLIESMKWSHRRICVRNSILLAMKDVQNSLASIKKVHSLLCLCPFNQYPVTISFGWRLLRVMNATTIRLYEFPDEVVKLVHLRYLGLTCNGELPSSISNLWKLRYLIIKRYVNIKSYVSLPVEIWDMKELEHLQIVGGHLPDHKRGDSLLKLSTLLGVSVQSCRDEVLKWIPNLVRLGIQIELEPDDKFDSFHFLDNIHHLGGLRSLKCVVVNSRIKSGVVLPMLKFPSNLQKLSLSGLGYQWEQMSIIGQLKNLEMLKLKGYAFQGPKWEINDYTLFPKLRFLLLEGTNLVRWNMRLPFVTNLMCLSIKHCYKLKELPYATHFFSVTNMEIVDCNTSTVSWAKETARILACKLKVHLSWTAPQNKVK